MDIDDDVIIEEEVITSEDIDPRQRAAQNRHKQMGYEPEANDDEPSDEEAIVDEEIDDGMVEIKVNGEVRKVEKKKIDKAGGKEIYQKKLSADLGLQNLSDQRKLLEEQRRIFAEQQAQFAREQQAFAERQQNLPKMDDSTNKDSDLSHDGRLKLVKEYHQAMYDGDDDRANELFLKINGPGNQTPIPQVNPSEIASQAANQALQQIQRNDYQRRVTDANQVFENEFKDVAGDPRLRQLANEETKIILRENPNADPLEVITEASNRVRSWYGDKSGNSSSEDKRASKRSMSSVKASSSQRSTPKPPPQRETDSDYISRLRRERGLE